MQEFSNSQRVVLDDCSQIKLEYRFEGPTLSSSLEVGSQKYAFFIRALDSSYHAKV